MLIPLGIVAALVLVTPIVALAVLSWLAQPPAGLGLHDGRLAGCPASPNCVSTEATDDAHRIAPLRFTGTAEEARERLRRVLDESPRVTIVRDDGDYLYAEFRSPLFRFVDDVEFHIDAAAGEIRCRSASRVGRSDLGVNRARLEDLRQRLAAPDGA